MVCSPCMVGLLADSIMQVVGFAKTGLQQNDSRPDLEVTALSLNFLSEATKHLNNMKPQVSRDIDWPKSIDNTHRTLQ